MDDVVLALFLLATFLGGITSSLAGFAMGIVLSSMWLHILTPMQTAILIVGYGLLAQGCAIRKWKHAPILRKDAPFILGGAIGVPIGAMLLAHYVNSTYLRPGFGLLLVLYCAYLACMCDTYGLVRPAFRSAQFGVSADTAIGIANGVIGGLTGLTGLIVTIWCQLRGWSRDEQRSVFQPVNFAVMVMSAVSLSVAGAVTVETVKLYLLGLPLMMTGQWIGFKLYGRLDEAALRRVMPLLLFLSGLVLIVRHIDLSTIRPLFAE